MRGTTFCHAFEFLGLPGGRAPEGRVVWLVGAYRAGARNRPRDSSGPGGGEPGGSRCGATPPAGGGNSGQSPHTTAARERAWPSIRPTPWSFTKATLPLHPNGMRFWAWDHKGNQIAVREYYSIGGGFIVTADDAAIAVTKPNTEGYAFPQQLLAHCHATGSSISRAVLEHEMAQRPEREILARLARIWGTMQDCVARGCQESGVLPGGLQVAAPGTAALSGTPQAA